MGEEHCSEDITRSVCVCVIGFINHLRLFIGYISIIFFEVTRTVGVTVMMISNQKHTNKSQHSN